MTKNEDACNNVVLKSHRGTRELYSYAHYVRTEERRHALVTVQFNLNSF